MGAGERGERHSRRDGRIAAAQPAVLGLHSLHWRLARQGEPRVKGWGKCRPGTDSTSDRAMVSARPVPALVTAPAWSRSARR